MLCQVTTKVNRESSLLYKAIRKYDSEALHGRLSRGWQRNLYASQESFGFVTSGIDALCIVQDDPGDWLQEAARVADVYGGSCLVISASRSANVHQWLLDV